MAQYKSKKKKSPLKKIRSIYNVGDGDEEMNDKLSRISGQKGMEKSLKDKIGKSLNRGDPSEVYDKMLKRINKERK